MSGWGWVFLGGVLEVGFIYCLKMEQQDARYGAGFLVCAILSFEFLARSLKTLPLNLVYAVWTGIGTVGAVILEVGLFDQPISPLRLGLMVLLVLALVSLKLTGPKGLPSQAPSGLNQPKPQ